jgi:hypothetical protein
MSIKSPRTFLLLLISFSKLCLLGQEHAFAEYEWESEPSIHELNPIEEAEKAVVLYDLRAYEYRYDEDDDLVCYYTEHKLIHVNSESSVENYNTFYIPLYGVYDLLSLQARTILPDGQVLEVDESNIKELDNVENAGAFRIFAVEGLSEGGEVEYWYTVKRSPRYFGREVYQENAALRKARFELMSPANLVFEAKSYNGFAEAQDSMYETHRHIVCVQENIKAAHRERYANYEPHLQRVEFKLAYNLFSEGGRLFSWSDAAYRYHEVIYSFSKEELKAAEKFLADLDVKKKKGEELIESVEKGIKNSIQYQQGSGSSYENIDQIVENKFANEIGFLRLFAAIWEVKELEHELVLGGDRKVFPLDPDFDSWNYLESMFFYFPRYDRYLAPSNYEFRYGLVPYEWTESWALYINPEEEKKTGLIQSDLRLVPAVNAKKHYDDIKIGVAFQELSSGKGFKGVELDVSRSMAGYRANFIQPFFDRIPQETQQEVLEDILKSSGADAEILTASAQHGSEDAVYDELPFIIEGKLEAKSLIEKAGPKYLFKLGEVIGPQVEMYVERARQFDVDVEYPHRYDRVIEVNIPEGYQLKGLDDIIIDIQYDDQQGNPVMGFVSNYELEEDLLTVSIAEYYNKTEMPMQQFEDFRKVINAAADFNKVSLVLEKAP